MPDASRPPSGSVRGQLAALGLRPQKRLGQHFLSLGHVAASIASLAKPMPGEPIVEIGPGLGVLTEHLANTCDCLILVEMDVALAQHLQQVYADRPHVIVVTRDASTADFGEILSDRPRAIAVGNLPYNVGTQIVLNLLAQRRHFRRLVVMLQREVAQRLAATPGSKIYGALSIAAQLHADVRIAMRVGPDAFVPPPKVESAVVVLDLLPAPRVDVADPDAFVRLVRAVFNHRRKQLGNAAKCVVPNSAEAIERAGLDPRRRPETLSIDEFARLFREADRA